ncbi:MAG: nicotinate-nucleotide adenylyltransferase [Alphaproteobacteria bacterium]
MARDKTTDRKPAPAQSVPGRLARGLRIGLLGGSFNPAHSGHLNLSLAALKRLGLDRIWWMVSPQNPLKSDDGMAPFADRLASAEALARHPRIEVSDIEVRLGTRFTADTLAALVQRFPAHDFVWLMGADNLIQIPAWDRWSRIFHTVPVAVFARPSYSLGALASPAARRFRRYRLPESEAGRLAGSKPPAWVFCRMRLDPTSATALRARGAAWPPSPGEE